MNLVCLIYALIYTIHFLSYFRFLRLLEFKLFHIFPIEVKAILQNFPVVIFQVGCKNSHFWRPCRLCPSYNLFIFIFSNLTIFEFYFIILLIQKAIKYLFFRVLILTLPTESIGQIILFTELRLTAKIEIISIKLRSLFILNLL
jgi:hypothetical protein